MTWRPSADLNSLRQRAELLATVRHFFSERGVLEVETPLLSRATVTDPSLKPLCVTQGQSIDVVRYLQTSPEYHMKRLLAAHGEAIYQICKAFRDGEVGPRHNPEFTILEWYRPGFDLRALIDEVEALLRLCIDVSDVRRVSYAELFEETLGVNPHTVNAAALEQLAAARLDVGQVTGDKDLWLDLLLTHVVEPTLKDTGVCFVYDYPASQAALAHIVEKEGVPVAQRFEAYVDGVELANGYYELVDGDEQRRRFEHDNAKRLALNLPEHPIDENLLAAMASGMPACSGVALGVDRLLLATVKAKNLAESVAFDWNRA